MKLFKRLENVKYLIIGFLVLGIIVVLLDYGFERIIPNFFFLDSFSKDDVKDYWKAVINIVVVVISLVTLLQASDKFFLEQHIHNENQRKDTIRRYQDLVRTAIEILNDKIEDEGACLFAVQIMQNIVSLYEKGEFTRTLERQSEPYQIISIEGVVCLLKKHLDRVLGVQRDKEKIRQDVVQIIRLLYTNNGLWTQEDLKRCGVHRFKDVYINMEYFDCLLLKDMEFVNVVFDGNNDYIKIFFEGCNVFEKCIFYCNCTTFLKAHGNIRFEECELQGFRMVEFNDIIKDKERAQGTKSVEFTKTTFKGYVWLIDNVFHSIVIESCRFENVVYMHRIKVESEMVVCDTDFICGLDFQGSILKWQVIFKNCVCKKSLYFWETKFYKNDKVDFFEVYIDEFPAPNWRAELYEDKYHPTQDSKKYYFKDLFEIVQDEETKRRKLVNKY